VIAEVFGIEQDERNAIGLGQGEQRAGGGSVWLHVITG